MDFGLITDIESLILSEKLSINWHICVKMASFFSGRFASSKSSVNFQQQKKAHSHQNSATFPQNV